jgi:hypothetical protein
MRIEILKSVLRHTLILHPFYAQIVCYRHAEPQLVCALETVAAGGLLFVEEGLVDLDVLEMLAVEGKLAL